MQSKLKNHWKQIIVLWVVVVALYVAMGLWLNQARVSRFSAAEQREIFEDLQSLWCDNLEISDREQREKLDFSINRMQIAYKLTELDTRIIFQRELARVDAVQPCLYEAVTWTQCVARTDEQLALNINGIFSLSAAETQTVLALGESQGWVPHVCLSNGQPPG